jgi:hypothetical protein
VTILADASKVWAGREVEFRVFIDASPDIGLSL